MRPTSLPAGLAVRRLELPRCVVLELTGELDVATVDSLRRELGAAVESGMRLLVVDLDGLDFFGLAGLRPLIVAARRMTVRGGRLAVVGTQRRVFRLFTATAANKVIALYPSVSSALESGRHLSPRRGRAGTGTEPAPRMLAAGTHAPAER